MVTAYVLGARVFHVAQRLGAEPWTRTLCGWWVRPAALRLREPHDRPRCKRCERSEPSW